MQSFDDRPHQHLTNTIQHEGLERAPLEFIATGSDVTSTTSYKMEVSSHIAKIENDHGGDNEGWICADRKSSFSDDCTSTTGKTSDVFVAESYALPGLSRTYLPTIAPASTSPSAPRLRSFSIDAILGTQSDVNDSSSDCMARANNMASDSDDVIKSNRPRSRRSVRPKSSRRARRDVAANEEMQKVKFHGKSERGELPPAPPVLKTPDGKLFITQDAWEHSMNASPQNRLPHRMAFGNSNGNCNELSPIGVFSVSWPASSANQDPATSQAWNRHQQTTVSSCHGQRQGQSHVRHGPRSKRIRTIFTADQLHQLEAQFERQQYMVGTERFYLASSLRLTEAQVKVWFQNRRIKWRKQSVERQQAKMAVVSYNKLIDADEFEEVSENDDNTSYSDSNDVTESCYSSHDDVTRPTDRTELQAMVHPMFGMTNWSCMDMNGGSVMADVHRNNINAALLS